MKFDWLKERAIHGFIYITIALLLGFILYSAFLKPTNTQKTLVGNGGTANYYWQGSTVSPGFGGCVTLKAEKPKEIK